MCALRTADRLTLTKGNVTMTTFITIGLRLGLQDSWE
jgi:hypothetical protein